MQMYLQCQRSKENGPGWESVREMAAVATVKYWWDHLKGRPRLLSSLLLPGGSQCSTWTKYLTLRLKTLIFM